MKRFLISLMITLIALCSLSMSALASEAITVQLDGQPLVFSDAIPQIRDNRIFLPYRAVFEAMGAEVGYDGNVVTARRGSTEVSMTIGEITATVIHDGITETLTMDVAPFLDSSTWRTYVPVRFATDALGCSVGWDQTAQTAIIVDVQKLIDNALADKEITLLERFLAYTEKFSVETWAIRGTLKRSVSLLGSEPFPIMSGTVNGIVSGETSSELSMVMNLDTTDLMTHLAALQERTLTDLGVTEDELCMTKTSHIKKNTKTNTMYHKLNDELNIAMGIPADAWLSTDINTYPTNIGTEWNCMALAPKNMNSKLSDTLRSMCSGVSLNNRASDGYAELSALMESAAAALSDEGFVKTERGYETSLNISTPSKELSAVIVLDTTHSGTIKGYSIDVAVGVPADNKMQTTLLIPDLPLEQTSRMMSVSMDSDNQLDAALRVFLSPLITTDFTMVMDYASTTEGPDISLPAEAVVVDYLAYMQGLLE